MYMNEKWPETSWMVQTKGPVIQFRHLLIFFQTAPCYCWLLHNHKSLFPNKFTSQRVIILSVIGTAKHNNKQFYTWGQSQKSCWWLTLLGVIKYCLFFKKNCIRCEYDYDLWAEKRLCNPLWPLILTRNRPSELYGKMHPIPEQLHHGK